MVADEHTRPLGLSPGAGALVTGWVVAGVIARLTGTPVVIAMMAALVVTIAVEALAGWSNARRTRVVSIAGPTVTTVDSSAQLQVAVAGPDIHRSGRLRLSTSPHTDSEISVEVLRPGAGDSMIVEAVFRDPGIVTLLHTTIELAGPFGLIWWRHRSELAVEEVHVAPVGHDALLAVTSSSARHEGSVATQRGNHRGDVDGVRAWRDGDAVGSIHWPSSLRVGDLIVHDRAAVADEHWLVDLDELIAGPVDDSTAARLRRTLDEGLRRGHDVAVSIGGESFQVRSDDDAATWAAWTAEAVTPASPRLAWWRRPIRSNHLEPESTVGAPARWAAGAAALASLAMLVGALSKSAALIATIAVGLVLGVVVSTWLGRRSGRRPPTLQAAIVLAIVVALVLIAADARGIDGLLALMRGPMPDLLMLLVVLHGFEVVDRRTLRVHQAITFVVAAYAAGLRIDEALGWWIAAWGVAFFASLLLTGTSQRVRRVGATGGRSAVRSMAWVGSAIVGALVLLSVIPIPDGPASLGLPALSPDDAPIASPGALASPDGSPAPTEGEVDRGSIGPVVGYPGFTDSLDTSVRGDLGDEIVMRVRAPEPAFWRGQTFSEFDGRVWTVSPDTGTRRDGPIIDVPPTIGDASAAQVPTEEFTQTYYVETALPNVVFAAARPRQVVFDGSLWTRPDGALRSDVVLAPGSVYTVVSERVAVTADLLRAQGDLGEVYEEFRAAGGGEQRFLEPFLELPESTTQRTIDLAADLRAASTYDTILAYERWLGANTEYDLDAPVPADGDDAVDDFLFESQRGFCEQIASTLTIMLRSQGVPARLATGYVAGKRDRVSGVWKVRASDAHAWVEVWFPQTGWQAFDPTAAVPLAGEVDAGTVGGDLAGAALSSIASHRVELAVLAVAAMAVWMLSVAIGRWRHRRRRGRWGLLQDRFAALPVFPDPTPTDRPVFPDPTPTDRLTNPRRAALVDAGGDGLAAGVAAALDQAAFDPTWVDDDEVYTRTLSAVATLERSAR